MGKKKYLMPICILVEFTEKDDCLQSVSGGETGIQEEQQTTEDPDAEETDQYGDAKHTIGELNFFDDSKSDW